MLTWMVGALLVFWAFMLVFRKENTRFACSFCHETEEVTAKEMEAHYSSPEQGRYKCKKCRGRESADRTGGED